MKVVHLSNNDIGGAGIAARRLHLALLEKGVASFFLTKQKHAVIPNHVQFKPARQYIRKVMRKLGVMEDPLRKQTEDHLANQPAGYEHFSFPFSELDLSNHPLVKSADVLHLHWMSDGFLDYPTFFKSLKKPIVWTLHDMNPFTGGCHHADESIGYATNCRACPQLRNTIDENFADTILNIKVKAIDNVRKSLKIISPSKWLMECSMQSKVFGGLPHYQIPNISDTSAFFPLDKIECKRKLKLPLDKKVLLFVAKDSDNPRKGMHYLLEVLKMMKEEIQVCTVGKSGTPIPGSISFDYISDKSALNEIYNAADVFVLPSMAENFPNTVCESLLSGTPVVAFNIGGIPEMVNTKTGRLAEYKNASSLKDAIEFICNHINDFPQDAISTEARQLLNEEAIVQRHLAVYTSFKPLH